MNYYGRIIIRIWRIIIAMPVDCVFCRIVAGELPSNRIYEDADVLAFLDIAPLVKGHTLVIPKAHIDPFMQAPPDIITPLFLAVQRVARAMMTSLKADGINLHQSNGKVAGQVVPHLHVHVIPRFADDGLAWNWRAGSYADPAEAKAMLERIKAAIT